MTTDTTTQKMGELAHLHVEHPDGLLDVDATLLGLGSSHRPTHRHDERTRSCAACRWTEVRIYRPDDPDSDRPTYHVRTSGCSSLDGEVRLERVISTQSPDRVMETLPHRSGGKPQLPRVSIDAMTEAAERDRNLRSA